MNKKGKMVFEKIKPFPVDPLVAALTARRIDFDISTYLKLLDDEALEARVQDFLANHSYFFNGILRMFGASPLYSKIRFGAEYEADFAFFDSGSFGTEWHLIEIEAPDKRMFKKSGDPTADFTHALEQEIGTRGFTKT